MSFMIQALGLSSILNDTDAFYKGVIFVIFNKMGQLSDEKCHLNKI
jgi:hypothetical protein